MAPSQLLGTDTLRSFMSEHYLRLPFALAGGAKDAAELGDLAALGRALEKAEEQDVIVCQRGAELPGRWPRTLDAARALLAEGCTLSIRRAELFEPRLSELAAGFERELGAPINIHFFATPGGSWGFGWHYDVEEVFILQTAGRKEYQLRKNTVNPWPLGETMPADLRYEREIMPLMRCPLAAGDLLYIPSGYWHRAESPPGELSLSLSVGVMAPTAVSLFDQLRREVLDSMLWRQRLPPSGTASGLAGEELAAQYRALLDQLAADLASTLRNKAFLRKVLPQ